MNTLNWTSELTEQSNNKLNYDDMLHTEENHTSEKIPFPDDIELIFYMLKYCMNN